MTRTSCTSSLLSSSQVGSRSRRCELRTDLIPGHETTSGVLSFCIHFLLTTPDAYAKLRHEVDSVIGDRVVTLEDISKMPYMTGQSFSCDILRRAERNIFSCHSRSHASLPACSSPWCRESRRHDLMQWKIRGQEGPSHGGPNHLHPKGPCIMGRRRKHMASLKFW